MILSDQIIAVLKDNGPMSTMKLYGVLNALQPGVDFAVLDHCVRTLPGVARCTKYSQPGFEVWRLDDA